jgi:hypothetical protein
VSVLPAPPSGQAVRLRQGKAPSEGYLQLFLDNRWGFACDSGSWGAAEAAVVCRQLGFSRGLLRTTQGLVHGKVEEGSKATESIRCAGTEDRLEDCALEREGGNCRLEQDIVSISCQPDSWASCDVGLCQRRVCSV